MKYSWGMVTIDTPRIDFDALQPSIRPYSSEDFLWGVELLEATGGRYRVRRGAAIDVAVLPGLIAEQNGQPVALLTLARHREELEIVVVASHTYDVDLLRLLIDAAKNYASPMCRRVYTICSNAELELQRQLQIYGFRLSNCRPGNIEAVERRETAPLTMMFNGLLVRDELEFEQLLP